MHLLISNFGGNPNIGAYGLATEKYCLLGKNVDIEIAKKVEEALGVPVHRIDIAGTDLVGVFCVANENKLLLPQIVFDEELKRLDELKIEYQIIETNLTALGNNIACNNKGAIINEDFSDAEKKVIEKALGVKAVKMKIADTYVPGSCIVETNKYAMVHREVTEEEQKIIEETLGVKADTGTVNLGSPFVRSAIINNEKGMIISRTTTGPEINNADNVLGYVNG